MTCVARILTLTPRVAICALVVMVSASAWGQTTANPAGPSVEVDDRNRHTLIESALRAFDRYLESVDSRNLDEARLQALDPGYAEGRLRVVEKLLAFIRGRQINKIENEGMVVRVRGDWALVVYQYDTVVNNETTRVITTAWMVQTDGTWKQFVVAPRDAEFWKTRRGDFEELQDWFDEHAREVAGQDDSAMVVPVPVHPFDEPLPAVDRY